jgi:hypothetical protein
MMREHFMSILKLMAIKKKIQRLDQLKWRLSHIPLKTLLLKFFLVNKI